MRYFFYSAIMLIILFGFMASPATVWAHGIVGKRFFPAGIVVDDPFPADELTLASPSYIKTPDGKETSIGWEYQKRLSPNLGLSIGSEFVHIDPNDSAESTQRGWSNPELTLIYSAFKSPAHEYIASTSVSVSPGGYGTKGIREEMSAIEPAFSFGRGFGDLPDSMDFFKPFAVVGRLGLETPWGRNDDAEELTSVFHYGLVLEYSVPYLQSFVKDVGIPKPFSQMFPIIELTYDEPMNGPDAHKGTGYWNPGILWVGRYVELGIEAQIPLNDRTGKNTGVIGLVHLFLDDIAPDIFSWTPFSGTLGPTRGSQ